MLLDRYGGRLHSMALRLCGNRADAEDAVQDAFLEAYRKWHTFEGRSDPGTWLATIALRRCRRRMRARTRDRRALDPASLLPWSERTITAVGAEGDGAPARERREALSLIQAAIPGLPEHWRLPVVLREVIGLPVADVAAILDLAPNTVKTRLHRGRLALRKALMRGVASVAAPAPVHERAVCVDLLRAKMDALDRGALGAARRLPAAEVCARCRAVFRELDMVHEACAEVAAGAMPASLRHFVRREIDRAEASRSAAPGRARRGRPPVKRSRSSRAR